MRRHIIAGSGAAGRQHRHSGQGRNRTIPSHLVSIGPGVAGRRFAGDDSADYRTARLREACVRERSDICTEMAIRNCDGCCDNAAK